MEKTMSVEDKIRRAEEIYYKRREQEIPIRENIEITRKKANNKDKNKMNIKLFKKVIKQIVVCVVIYSGFYVIINNNYVFSEDFTNKTKEILNQDINFKAIYNKGINEIKKWNEKINKEDIDTNNKIENDNSDEQKIDSNDENIGGAIDSEIEQENEKITENSEELSQMEQDANYIKNTINFIKPIEGKISSEFGLRNPTTVTVPKNHTGTDIAAETGTKIISATDGKVILASSTGDYGKHLKIKINDVVIVYAHCNNLYVNEGENIKQGQEIAEVGSTGNATGPHLHFEIRRSDRYVNPQLVLEL